MGNGCLCSNTNAYAPAQKQETLKKIDLPKEQLTKVANHIKFPSFPPKRESLKVVSKTILINLCLINQGQKEFEVQKTMTVRELKVYIYNNFYKDLIAQQFVLTFSERVLSSNEKIGSISPSSQSLILYQDAALVWQIDDLDSDQDTVDPKTGERGVAFASCTHFFSRSGMKQIVNNQINSGKCQIRCPKQNNRKLCNTVLSSRQWRLIAGYTVEEYHNICNRLSQNNQLIRQQSRLNQPKQESITLENKKQRQSDYGKIKKYMLSKRLSLEPLQMQVQKKPKIQSEQKNMDRQLRFTRQSSPLPAILSAQDILPKIIQIAVRLTLINSKKVKLTLQISTTVQALKDIIFKQHYTHLRPQQTVLLCNGLLITNKLQSLSLNNKLKITQRKAEIWEIGQLKTDKHKEDLISCQVGVAIMKCNHQYSRNTLKSLVKAELDEGKTSIQCGQRKQNTQTCNQDFSQREYMLIGGYTDKEVRQISDQRSKNWISLYCKNCPFCKQSVTNLELTTKRVKCSSCKKQDFCFTCLSPWTGSGSLCMSDGCKFYRDRVTNAPLSRQFKYRYNGENITVNVPNVRACPRCGQIIENTQACKHTKCPCRNLNNSFCFVCLSIGPPWTCGTWNQYCGRVAPNQTFT